jgi:hypothetical protein
MSNRASFTDNCEAITHDSDIRKLTFVSRDVVTGVETPLVPATRMTLADAENVSEDDAVIFTKPYEIRNRNKASFNLKFTPPADTVTYTDGNPQIGESLVSSVFNAGNESWGFATEALTADGTPAFLLLEESEIPAAANSYMDSLRIEVTVPFSGDEVGEGQSLTMDIIDPNSGTIFQTIDLTTNVPGVYQTMIGYHTKVNNQQMIARLTTSSPNGLEAYTTGTCTVSRHSYGFAIEKTYFDNAGSYSHHPGNTYQKTIYFGNIPTGGKLTRVYAVVTIPYVSLVPGFGMGMKIKAEATTLISFDPAAPISTVNGPVVFDSGPISYIVPFFPGPAPWFTATLEVMGGTLADLEPEGLVTYIYEWENATSEAFEWTEGDQLHVLAFASLDDLQYTPIAMARHDWSNTPFVDITKFEPFEIPSDFDPTGGYPPGIPPIDNIAFRNSIMLFMSDFDNASTWNYIRFLIAWVPQEASANGVVYLEITANAREL